MGILTNIILFVEYFSLFVAELTMSRCGKCQQFTRTSENQKDLCGAWDQPTMATREACEFYIPKKPQRESKEKQVIKSTQNL